MEHERSACKSFNPGLAADLDPDLHNVFVDDESYNSGHGHAYEKYCIDPTKGAVIVVRPDQCKSTPDSFLNIYS